MYHGKFSPLLQWEQGMLHLRSIYPDLECCDKQIKKIFGERLPGKAQ